jgi:hypothetical protein
MTMMERLGLIGAALAWLVVLVLVLLGLVALAAGALELARFEAA